VLRKQGEKMSDAWIAHGADLVIQNGMVTTGGSAHRLDKIQSVEIHGISKGVVLWRGGVLIVCLIIGFLLPFFFLLLVLFWFYFLLTPMRRVEVSLEGGGGARHEVWRGFSLPWQDTDKLNAQAATVFDQISEAIIDAAPPTSAAPSR
jgi:hypothetical protein